MGFNRRTMKLNGIDMIKGNLSTNTESSVIGHTTIQFENLSDENKEKLNDIKSKMIDGKITKNVKLDLIDLLNRTDWAFISSNE